MSERSNAEWLNGDSEIDLDHAKHCASSNRDQELVLCVDKIFFSLCTQQCSEFLINKYVQFIQDVAVTHPHIVNILLGNLTDLQDPHQFLVILPELMIGKGAQLVEIATVQLRKLAERDSQHLLLVVGALVNLQLSDQILPDILLLSQQAMSSVDEGDLPFLLRTLLKSTNQKIVFSALSCIRMEMQHLSETTLALVIEVIIELMPSSRNLTDILLNQILRSSRCSEAILLFDVAAVLVILAFSDSLYFRSCELIAVWCDNSVVPFARIDELLSLRVHNEVWNGILPGVWKLLCFVANWTMQHGAQGQCHGHGHVGAGEVMSAVTALMSQLYDCIPSLRETMVSEMIKRIFCPHTLSDTRSTQVRNKKAKATDVTASILPPLGQCTAACGGITPALEATDNVLVNESNKWSVLSEQTDYTTRLHLTESALFATAVLKKLCVSAGHGEVSHAVLTALLERMHAAMDGNITLPPPCVLHSVMECLVAAATPQVDSHLLIVIQKLLAEIGGGQANQTMAALLGGHGSISHRNSHNNFTSCVGVLLAGHLSLRKDSPLNEHDARALLRWIVNIISSAHDCIAASHALEFLCHAQHLDSSHWTVQTSFASSSSSSSSSSTSVSSTSTSSLSSHGSSHDVVELIRRCSRDGLNKFINACAVITGHRTSSMSKWCLADNCSLCYDVSVLLPTDIPSVLIPEESVCTSSVKTWSLANLSERIVHKTVKHVNTIEPVVANSLFGLFWTTHNVATLMRIENDDSTQLSAASLRLVMSSRSVESFNNIACNQSAAYSFLLKQDDKLITDINGALGVAWEYALAACVVSAQMRNNDSNGHSRENDNVLCSVLKLCTISRRYLCIAYCLQFLPNKNSGLTPSRKKTLVDYTSSSSFHGIVGNILASPSATLKKRPIDTREILGGKGSNEEDLDDNDTDRNVQPSLKESHDYKNVVQMHLTCVGQSLRRMVQLIDPRDVIKSIHLIIECAENSTLAQQCVQISSDKGMSLVAVFVHKLQEAMDCSTASHVFSGAISLIAHGYTTYSQSKHRQTSLDCFKSDDALLLSSKLVAMIPSMIDGLNKQRKLESVKSSSNSESNLEVLTSFGLTLLVQIAFYCFDLNLGTNAYSVSVDSQIDNCDAWTQHLFEYLDDLDSAKSTPAQQMALIYNKFEVCLRSLQDCSVVATGLRVLVRFVGKFQVADRIGPLAWCLFRSVFTSQLNISQNLLSNSSKRAVSEMGLLNDVCPTLSAFTDKCFGFGCLESTSHLLTSKTARTLVLSCLIKLRYSQRNSYSWSMWLVWCCHEQTCHRLYGLAFLMKEYFSSRVHRELESRTPSPVPSDCSPARHATPVHNKRISPLASRPARCSDSPTMPLSKKVNDEALSSDVFLLHFTMLAVQFLDTSPNCNQNHHQPHGSGPYVEFVHCCKIVLWALNNQQQQLLGAQFNKANAQLACQIARVGRVIVDNMMVSVINSIAWRTSIHCDDVCESGNNSIDWGSLRFLCVLLQSANNVATRLVSFGKLLSSRVSSMADQHSDKNTISSRATVMLVKTASISIEALEKLCSTHSVQLVVDSSCDKATEWESDIKHCVISFARKQQSALNEPVLASEWVPKVSNQDICDERIEEAVEHDDDSDDDRDEFQSFTAITQFQSSVDVDSSSGWGLY